MSYKNNTTQIKSAAEKRKNGLDYERKREKLKSRRRKTLHYGSVPVYILQQRYYAILQR
jgi:hypothetical protein